MHVYGMPGHLIRRLNQMSTHAFTRQVQDSGYDMTPVQFAAMDAIIANPGIDQASVAARIAYDRATIGGVIDRLEQKGFVERKVNRRDRRAREVRPTDTGRAAFEALLPVVSAVQQDILARLSPAEREVFMSLATKAVATMADDLSAEPMDL